MKKKIAALVLTALMALPLGACSGNSTASTEESSQTSSETSAAAASEPADKTYTVGICQLVQHPALDAATEGFKQALTDKLGDKVSFDEQNASGDTASCATICNQFVSSNVDLIMANATPALQAAQTADG
jgi:putative tryptophan/tyrosine transport system substrate-binding protein